MKPFVVRLTEEQRKEQRELLLTMIADGLTKTAACTALGISKNAVAAWITKDEEFAARWRRARIEQVHSMADAIVDISDEPIAEGDMAAIQRQRLRVEARKWATSKWAPRLYGEKLRDDATMRTAVILLPSVHGPGGLKQIANMASIANGVHQQSENPQSPQSPQTGGVK